MTPETLAKAWVARDRHGLAGEPAAEASLAWNGACSRPCSLPCSPLECNLSNASYVAVAVVVAVVVASTGLASIRSAAVVLAIHTHPGAWSRVGR